MVAIRELVGEQAGLRVVNATPIERGEFIEIEFGDDRVSFVAKIETTPDPRGLVERMQRWSATTGSGAPALLASTYIAPSLKRALEAAGLGWIERGGMHLKTSRHLIHIEGGARPAKSRLGASSPAVQKTSRALLEKPNELWSLVDITSATGIHPSSASRALANLVEEGLVSKEAGGWSVVDGTVLLDHWLERMQARRNQKVERYFFTHARLRETAERIVGAAGDHRIAFTGRFAAESISPVVAASRLDIYVHPFHDVSNWAEEILGWMPLSGPEEATVVLKHSPDGGAFIGSHLEGPTPVVGRAQLIADLTQEGGRSQQAVTALRETWGLHEIA